MQQKKRLSRVNRKFCKILWNGDFCGGIGRSALALATAAQMGSDPRTAGLNGRRVGGKFLLLPPITLGSGTPQAGNARKNGKEGRAFFNPEGFAIIYRAHRRINLFLVRVFEKECLWAGCVCIAYFALPCCA